MIKILYIVTQSEWGGAQAYIFDLANNLPKNKYQVAVASGPGSGEFLRRLRASAIPVHQLKYLTRAVNPLYDLLAVGEIKKLIKKFKPGIVHLNSSKAGVVGSLSARLAKTPKIIYTAHGFVFNENLNPIKKIIYRKLELWGSSRINKIITVSNFDRRSGVNIGIDPDKIITIHNGLDTKSMPLLEPAQARKIINDKIDNRNNSKIIGVIANLYFNKGLDVLIRALLNVKAKLVIIGQGEEKDNLRNLIIDLRLNKKVFLLGYMENACQYLPGFDLFVLPSRKEGFPYVLLEAGLARVPVVATNVGGVPEIIHHKINGYLTIPNKPDNLAQVINTALIDPLPFHLDNDFTLQKMLNETMRIYEE